MGRRHRPVVDAFFPTWYEVTLLPRQVRRADRFDLTCWVRGASASGRRAAHQANRRGTSGKGHRPVVDAPFRGAVRGHTSAAPGEEWTVRCSICACRRREHRPVVDAPYAKDQDGIGPSTGRFAW